MEKKKKRIKVRSAKNKGMQFQKEVGVKISELTGLSFGKDEVIASRESGAGGTDIRLIGLAKELFNYAVECKRAEKLSIPTWIKQARSNQGDFKNWLLFFRRNNEKAMVVLEMDHFFELLKKIEDKKDENN